ncbi:hypothetical protein B4U79_05882 [Dinothrombium tinctorium]|uniref:FHOD1 N-terminal GTPase-binding domain-containing protein n=1 Tax=Dinothrombium tinctorium TaxID=1965070 RepID=A0A3S3SIL1_9ACAR|nr:hypothetical protein B4U79_07282 [Dinothrombium tinctorium]RWS14574.1 hypothetical protein B4U79_05882 [Dinothrombium tinctorium]
MKALVAGTGATGERLGQNVQIIAHKAREVLCCEDGNRLSLFMVGVLLAMVCGSSSSDREAAFILQFGSLTFQVILVSKLLQCDVCLKMTLTCRVQYLNDIDPFSASTNFPEPPRPPSYTFNVNIPLINQIAGVHRLLKAPHRLDDCTFQLYKYQGGENALESDCYGAYLDLESTIDEQSEDFDGFQDQ